MNLLACKQSKRRGSILVTTVVLSAVLGVTLSGYLYWVRSQNVLVKQSQAWNEALALAEAGIEEGMAQINAGFGTNFLSSIQTNWPCAGNGVYGPRSNSLVSGSYSVIVLTTMPFPTIIATGYAQVPLVGRPVTRVVQVTTTNTTAFSHAMYVERTVTFNGNNIDVDSYDSTDPLHSTNGFYCSATRKAGGDVCTTFGIVNVNNADVNGKLRTGPTGSYNLGPGGFVGDVGFTGPGIQEGWYQDDFNLEVKAVTPPNTDNFVSPAGAGTNKFVLSNGSYIINGDLRLATGDTLLVSGSATLYVSGRVDMSGQSQVVVQPGAKLVLYVAGSSANFTTVNNFGNAAAFQYYGLPANTAVTWSGNSTYVGTIYAPQATFTAGGGGTTIYDFQGACVVQAMSMNGHFKFHFDEGLSKTGPVSGYTATSWREL